MLNDFHVRIHGDSETLTGFVGFPSGRPPGSQIAFYLSRNGRFVERRPYSRDTSAVFLLQAPGEYSVRAFVRCGEEKVAKKSVTHHHLHSDSPFTSRDRSLPFTPLAYPHRDIAVITLSNRAFEPTSSAMKAVEEITGLQITRATVASKPAFVVHPFDAEVDAGRTYFSGVACTNDRFIFGPRDAGPKWNDDFEGAVGDFSRIDVSARTIEIGTDYFGVGKMYYFSGQGISCAANRTHLLLIVLRAFGIELTISSSAIRAMLQASTQVFTQSFSTSIGVEDCQSLAPGLKLSLGAGAMNIGPSAISDILEQDTDQVVGPAEYDELLAAGCSEIENNLRLALEHPDFSRIRLDVTGGLDSRTLTAALSRMPAHLDHVELHTADFASSPHDLPISLRLSRDMPFPYDTGERTTYDVDADTVLLENVSMHLGTYFGIRAEGARTRLPGTLCINGFFGEASMRPYFARLLYGKDEEFIDPREFPQRHIDAIGTSRRPISRDHELHSEFRREFDALPGKSTTARFDALYLYHRNGLHCSDRWMSHVRAPSWGPLQSKSLFSLKWRTLDTYRGLKVQIDATEMLNSEIAHIPVGREKDNAERAAYDSTYPASVTGAKGLPAPTDSDRHRFVAAGRERQRVARRLKGSRTDTLRAKNVKRLERHLGWLLSVISELEGVHELLSPIEAAELRDYVRGEYSPGQGKLGPAGTAVTGKILSAVYLCREAKREVAIR